MGFMDAIMEILACLILHGAQKELNFCSLVIYI